MDTNPAWRRPQMFICSFSGSMPDKYELMIFGDAFPGMYECVVFDLSGADGTQNLAERKVRCIFYSLYYKPIMTVKYPRSTWDIPRLSTCEYTVSLYVTT